MPGLEQVPRCRRPGTADLCTLHVAPSSDQLSQGTWELHESPRVFGVLWVNPERPQGSWSIYCIYGCGQKGRAVKRSR